MKQADIKIGQDYQMARTASNYEGIKVRVLALGEKEVRYDSNGAERPVGYRKDHVRIVFPDSKTPEKTRVISARQIQRPWSEFEVAKAEYIARRQAERETAEKRQELIEKVELRLKDIGLKNERSAYVYGSVEFNTVGTLEKFLEFLEGSVVHEA